MAADPDWFGDADVVVVADAGPWVAGDPVITTSLRGDCDVTVEVRTLRSALHSGDFGGPVPDALTVLARVLATLHDDAGDLAVPGLDGGEWEGMPLDEERFRDSAGLLPGVELMVPARSLPGFGACRRSPCLASTRRASASRPRPWCRSRARS